MARSQSPDGESNATSILSGIHRPVTLVAQVESTIRAAIEDGVFPDGRLPTLEELADQLRVSRETIRLALEPLQREGLIVKRRRRGTCVRHPEGPVMLKSPRAKVLGFLLEECDFNGDSKEVVVQPSFGPMLEGAVLEASRHGYLVSARSAKRSCLRRTLLELQAANPLCGIVFARVADERFLKGISSYGIPSVLLDHELRFPTVDSIRGDSEQKVTLAVRQLSELGHQRIACAAQSKERGSDPQFIQKYRRAMRDVGLRRCRAWEVAVKPNPCGAEEAVDQLLGASPRPTGIVCCDNAIAQLFAIAARDQGLHVPNDLSVVGCGGDQAASLSCTQLDWKALGCKAVQMLLKSIDARKAAVLESSEPEHVLVPFQWRAGITTAKLN